MIAILGAGMMGEALLAGLLGGGWAPADIRAVDASPARCTYIGLTYGVPVLDALDAVRGVDTVIVAVKPNNVAELLDDIGPALGPGCLVVSLAAGVTVTTLEAHLPPHTPVVRAMPNTAALVGEAMTVICAGTSATTTHLTQAEAILKAVGQVRTAPEKQMDIVTAVSGSGPAYVMYIAEAMIDAGVLLGLPRALASDLVKQTLYGSSKLLVTSGEHPTVLKENVVSPGGTTAAALRALDEHGVKVGFTDAIEAAYARSRELGTGN